MNTFWWIVVAGIILLTVFIGLPIYYRLRKKPLANSRGKVREGLEKKRGTGRETVVSSESRNGGGKNGDGFLEGLKKHQGVGFNVFIILVGAMALYWGFTTDMRPSDVGVLAQKYWLAVIIGWAILATLIAYIDAIQWKSGLQWILGGTALMILFGLPFWTLVPTPSVSSSTMQTTSRPEIPLVSSPRTSWPVMLMLIAEKSRKIGIPPGMRFVLYGADIRIYCEYRDKKVSSYLIGETPCPDGDMPFFYLENLAPGENVARYAFAPL